MHYDDSSLPIFNRSSGSVVPLTTFAGRDVFQTVVALLYHRVVSVWSYVRLQSTNIVSHTGDDQQSALARRIGYYEGWAPTR